MTKNVVVGVNDLATVSPEIAAEWHPTRNNDLTAQQVLAGTHKKGWWLGSCGHEWDARIVDRLKNRGKGCPFCSGVRILAGFNDLLTRNSKLASQWHPIKNHNLTPQQVGLFSNRKAWWLGECSHEWETKISDRSATNNGCPYCSNHRILLGFNDLSSQCPTLAAEWHPTKNGTLSPQQVIAGGKRKFWWRGACLHEWEAIMENRVKAGHGCPYCAGKRVLAGFNDLATIDPIVATEWHPTKNGNLTAQQVTFGSDKKFWWQCSKEHEWEAMLSNRTGEGKKRGCPVCSGHKVLAGYNDLASFDPVIAAEWHPTKNGKLTPHMVTRFTSKKVWWHGAKCSHEWLGIIANRTIQRDGCPICSGHQVLPGYSDLVTTHPTVAAEWHPTKNGKLTPHMVSKATNKNVWWLGKCGHEWKMSLGHRTSNRNSGCTICSGRKVLYGFNDLATTHPIVAAEWHPFKNLNLLPTEVYRGSNKRVWWQGSCGHEWQTTVNKRTVRGQGCGQCTKSVSKAEEQLKDFLLGLGEIVEGSNRTLLKGKEIDIWLPEHKVGIEFNGIYWHSEKFAGRNSHYDKWTEAGKAGIQLIQIWEDDWNLRSEIIMRTLAHKLGASKTGLVSREIKAIPVSQKQAEKFLNESHLQGFASGSYYLGIVEKGDTKKLQAVMVLETEPNSEHQELEIRRYASIANINEDFSRLMAYAINTYSPESLTIIADHCEANEEFYITNGFIAEKDLPSDYMYVIRSERRVKSDYSLERFRDDPNLQWEDGLTEMELADLNGLNRIWDAGRTSYRLSK